MAALLDGTRICTITGAGGAGKTRLAHAVAEDLAPRVVGSCFADGVVWIELSGLGSVPIVSLPDERLRPGRKALEEIMESLK